MEDGLARAAIERLTDEPFRFGYQTKKYECRLLEGQVNMEQYVTGSQEKKIKTLQKALRQRELDNRSLADNMRLL